MKLALIFFTTSISIFEIYLKDTNKQAKLHQVHLNISRQTKI